MQSTYDKGCDELTDESGAIDICAHCAAENKFQPGLYFCFQCGPFGRYICGDCHKQHRKFLNGHEIRDVSAAAKHPRRTSDTDKDSSSLEKTLLPRLKKIWIQTENDKGKVKEPTDLTAMLDDLEKYIKDGKVFVESESDLRKENASLLSQIRESERKILTIWNKLERGQKRQDLNSSDALNELENFVTEVKQTKVKQQEETNAVNMELQTLEKEIEDVTQIKLGTRNENDSNSQRIKNISLTIKGKKKTKRTDEKLLDDINRSLAELVEDLKDKHTQLIGSVQAGLSEKRDSTTALVSDLRHLFTRW